jgi:hypothetical protein
MVRVARPGGLITVQDQDFGSLTLDHPDRALTTRIMDGVVGRMYPDPFSGRTIFGRLVRLGLRQVRLAVEVFQDTKLEPYTHAMLRRRAENAIRLDLAVPGRPPGGSRTSSVSPAAANSPSHSTTTRPGE